MFSSLLDLVPNSLTTQTTSILSSTSTSIVGVTTSSDPQISSGVAIWTETTSFYNTDETSSSPLTSSVVTNVTSSSEALVTLSSSSEQSKGVTEVDSAILQLILKQQLVQILILEPRRVSPTMLLSQPAIMLIWDI